MAGKTKRKAPYNPATDAIITGSKCWVLVDNPYATEEEKRSLTDDGNGGMTKGGKSPAQRSIIGDPLAEMHVRKTITDSQCEGGRGYQRDWEGAMRGAKAIDPAKEYVSGGLVEEGMSDSQRESVLRLAYANGQLGSAGREIASKFLIDALTIEMIMSSEGRSGERWRDYFSKRIKECLETLAGIYGFGGDHANLFRRIKGLRK
jgi:hypothetical protein